MKVVYEFDRRIIKLNVPLKMCAKVISRLEQDRRVIVLSVSSK